MPYSFTEKKRIRKNFGRQPSILEVPYLLAIQLDSYRSFLQADTRRGCAAEHRPACGIQERVPDLELLGQRGARIRQLSARRAGVRRQGVPAARPDLCGAAARQGAADRVRQGSRRRQEADQGRARAGGLSRRAAADDRQRHLHRQRHRARDRQPAAPLAGRVLRSRSRQDPFLGQAAVLGPHHSLPRLLARFRVRSQGLRVRAHRPAPQAAGVDHPACARHERDRDPRRVLREEHLRAHQGFGGHAAGAAAPARRDRDLRHPHRRSGDRRGRPAHHRAPRAPARGLGRQAAARAARVPARQDPGARRGQHRTPARSSPRPTRC